MAAVCGSRGVALEQRRIDWMDIRFAVALGVIMIVVKLLQLYAPASGVSRTTTDEIASILTIGYILTRARRTPEKLDDWGLTTRLTGPAILTGVVLLGVTVGVLAAAGRMAAGRLSFRPEYVTQMIEYIAAAFPQQFVLCSIGLVTLETLRPFRGAWRLPLAVGLGFCLAHFWTPARFPGTIIPIQMPLTFVAGFVASFYFLKFRSILPLTVIHAIVYPLLNNWIERHL